MNKKIKKKIGNLCKVSYDYMGIFTALIEVIH